MKHLLVFLSCVVLAAMSVTVFAQEATPDMTAAAELEPWTCPEGYEGQTLNVYNWTTYIAEDTVANFEALCGVTVVYDVYESNEAMLARLRQGNPGYDIAVPSNYVVEVMVEEELIVPLDHSLIPNLDNLLPDFRETDYDPGNVYSVAYQWGTVGVGYDLDAVGEEITSWEQVWNYEGNVAWLEDARLMTGLALVLLGYDANSSNPDEIAQARDFLIERGGNVVAIAQDDGQVLLERGEADIVVEYNGDIFQVMADNPDRNIQYVLPVETAQAWVDNMVVLADAPNPELAHIWIDYILDPQVGADISNYTSYASPNAAAIDAGLINEEQLNNPAIYPTDEILANLFFSTENPEGALYITDAWDELKIVLGQ